MRRFTKRKNTAPSAEAGSADLDQANEAGTGPAPVDTKERNEKAPAAEVKSKRKEAAAEPPFWEFIFQQGDRWTTDGLMLYLYRVWPKINLGEDRHYITTTREPIDELWVRDHYGSGRYMLLLKDARHKLVRTNTFSVHEQDFPPRVADAEVLRSPENDLYFKVWAPVKKPNGKPEKESATSTDVNQLLTTVLEKTGSFDPKLAELWKETAQQRDEMSKALAEKQAPPDMLALMKGMKDLFPSAPVQSSDKSEVLSVITALKGLQQPQQNPLEILRQAKEIFSPMAAADPQRDEIDRLDKVLAFAQRLATLQRPAGGGGGSNWDRGIDLVRELNPTIQGLINGYLALKSQTAGVPGVAGTAPAAAPGAFDPYANPDRLRQHAQNMNQATGATAPPPTPPGQAGPFAAAGVPSSDGSQAQGEIFGLLANYGSLVVNALNAGHSGAEFADDLSRLFGTATPAMIGRYGEEALSQAMLMTPEIALFGETRLRRFAHEFCHFEEILESESDAEDDEKVEAQASVA